MVDAIQAEYAGRGVVVVAVNVGEDESIVRQYLQKNPSSCAVALDESNSVASRFGMGGVPHYVVIDRNGNIVASRSGSAGEPGLRYMFSRADHEPSPKTGRSQTADRGALASASGLGPSLKWTSSVEGRASCAREPVLKTIFVLTDGEQSESYHYVIGGEFVAPTVAGGTPHRPALPTQKKTSRAQ